MDFAFGVPFNSHDAFQLSLSFWAFTNDSFTPTLNLRRVTLLFFRYIIVSLFAGTSSLYSIFWVQTFSQRFVVASPFDLLVLQISYLIILTAEAVVYDYSRVALEYLKMPSNYSPETDKATIIFEVGSLSDWEISMIPDYNRVSDKFEGCFIPFYDCPFKKLGV